VFAVAWPIDFGVGETLRGDIIAAQWWKVRQTNPVGAAERLPYFRNSIRASAHLTVTVRVTGVGFVTVIPEAAEAIGVTVTV